jgi:hypothetical protein
MAQSGQRIMELNGSVALFQGWADDHLLSCGNSQSVIPSATFGFGVAECRRLNWTLAHLLASRWTGPCRR